MTKWNADIMFPSDNVFQNRIISVKCAPSNDGNPMLTMEFEVVSPTMYEIPSVGEVDITNVKATTRSVYKMFGEDGKIDVEGTAKAQKRTKDLLVNLGIPEEDINWDNLGPVVSPLKGKTVMTQMNSKIDQQRKTPTASQIEEARKTGKRAEGDIMKHPMTGKDIIKYWPNIVEVYGLVPA